MSRPGHRSLSLSAALKRLIAPRGVLSGIASALLTAPARPVRVLYFDKTDDSNWAVPWHQDRTIAVSRRAAVPGFTVWSVKDGVDHVEPPADLLRGMAALRLHLDDCGQDNGPLKAVRGSCKLGVVKASDIRLHVEKASIVECTASAGDVVAMRGLTIHASDRSARPEHRRVIHVDYATHDLPDTLSWALEA